MNLQLAVICVGLLGNVYGQSQKGTQDQLAELPSADHCRLPEPPVSGHFFSVFCYGYDNTLDECLNLPNSPVRPNWTLTYICNEGYYLPHGVGYIDTWCEGGRWVPPLPTCLDRICEPPPKPANGYYISHPLDCTESCDSIGLQQDDSLLSLHCDAGFVPPEDNNALCVGGEWIEPRKCSKLQTEEIPTQTLIFRRNSCKMPEAPEHGTHFSAICFGSDCTDPECEGTPGTEVRDSWTLSFSCEEGYLPSTNQTYAHSKCINGQWQPPLPTCIVSLENRCRVPKPPRYGLYNITCSQMKCSDTPGTMVPRGYKLTLSCYEGYSPAEGYALSNCEDGVWSPPPPTCADASLDIVSQRDISALQSQNDGCVLPKPPKNGYYNLLDQDCQRNRVSDPKCLKRPGETVSHLQVITIGCDRGYEVGGQIGSTVLVSCNNGQWSHTFPECFMPCPKLVSRTVDIECYQGPNLVSCDGPMLPNTTVTNKCKLNHNTNDDPRNLVCLPNGRWSNDLPSCKPSCGLSKLKNYDITPTVVNGKSAVLGYFPWHAGIYHQVKDTDKWENTCGGTLISPHIVLTAAHCVTDHSKVLKNEEVRVALGKYYRDWYNNEEAVKCQVKEIKIQPNYLGQESLLDLDIAMLALDHPVTITSFVMPACVDYHLTFPLEKNMVGYVAGWGKTEECSACGDGSETLLYANTSYLSFLDCFNAMQSIKYFSTARITSDKFCAGNGSLSVVQKGDSGGGFTFEFAGVHYVKGIVSVKVNIPGAYSFSAFTNVSHHIAWVKTIASHFDTLIQAK